MTAGDQEERELEFFNMMNHSPSTYGVISDMILMEHAIVNQRNIYLKC